MAQNERYISFGGERGTDAVVQAVYDNTVFSSEVKDKTTEVLDTAWDAILKIGKNGGAVSAHGDILSRDIAELSLPEDIRTLLDERTIVGVNADDYNSWTGANFVTRFTSGHGEIQLVNSRMEERLVYRKSRNNHLTVGIQSSSGRMLTRPVSRLNTGFEGYIERLYSEAHIPRVVLPRVAVNQLLFEVAQTYGAGKASKIG